MANIEDAWQEDPEPVQIGHSSISRSTCQESSEVDSSDKSQNSQFPQISNEEASSNQVAAANQASFSFLEINGQSTVSIDWEKVNAACDQADKERWAKLPPIVKNFYIEDPEVSSMSPNQVEQWRRANFDIHVQIRRTCDKQLDLKPIPNPVLTFEQAFKNYPEILDAIYQQGLSKPSPIQSQAWPILLGGGDLIGISQTGTGKTLAFLLPALIHIEGQITPKQERQGPPVLILVPTRELAIQINKEVSKYKYKNIKSVCLYRGTHDEEDMQDVLKDVDIVIATPGRLRRLIVAGHLHAINFSYIVLDEADKLLNIDFGRDVRVSLFDQRPGHQTVMTSAAWSPYLWSQVKLYANDPIQINVGPLELAAVHTVTQQIMFVEDDDKMKILLKFITYMEPTDKVIVFCTTKASAAHVATEFAVIEIYCQLLYGDRDQDEREAALEEMLDGTATILIATDVASRGIHIQDLTHVINFDFPETIEDYVYRIGRTGRAGKTGTAITYFTRYDWEHAKDLIKILNEANQEVPQELEIMAQKYEEYVNSRRDNYFNRELELLAFLN
ncbi:putative ATP-dependent RNA helicase DDX43 [Papilio machaon]|uniref:RNA helicase n=1 Tax=Papilio machaon TaxID=76193 RepID=A0A194QZK4_PAPMA|nr:putative ATP-dependent RNA helicase DDX43 [Papilio machaon]